MLDNHPYFWDNRTTQKKVTPMQTYEEAIDMVLDVISEMRDSMNFHNPTLDELEQRIV